MSDLTLSCIGPKRAQTPPSADVNALTTEKRTLKASPSTSTSTTANSVLGSPSKSAIYDPRALLNPKGRAKAPPRLVTEDTRSSTEESFEPPTKDRQIPIMQAVQKRSLPPNGSGPKSMLEGLYGVEKRSDLPCKKAKVTTEQSENKSTSSGPQNRRSGGVVGEYMKPNPDENISAVTLSTLVDLTQGTDGDTAMLRVNKLTQIRR